jgi:hypothetical protein
MIAAAHHIASIRVAGQTMPNWKKDEFKTRLMDKSKGDIPALIEIAAASRIMTLGGQVRWIPEKRKNRGLVGGHQPVSIFRHSEESLKIRACARDLQRFGTRAPGSLGERPGTPARRSHTESPLRMRGA